MPTLSSVPPDGETVKCLLAGDEQAFARLVHQHHGAMLHLARVMVGVAFADDIVQETWIAVIRGLPRFDHRSSLKTWIFAILANVARSHLRHESFSTAVGDLTQDDGAEALPASRFDTSGHWKVPPLPWHDETPEALLATDQLRDCLEQVLGQLPAAQRAVLTLRDMEGMEMEQICNILAVSETNVRVLLHRARNRLRTAIENYHRGDGC
jgi:RNA polymerase sigma-70 factor (ECF subfamily)